MEWEREGVGAAAQPSQIFPVLFHTEGEASAGPSPCSAPLASPGESKRVAGSPWDGESTVVVRMAGFKSWPRHSLIGGIQTNDSTSLSLFCHPWKANGMLTASSCSRESVNEFVQCLAQSLAHSRYSGSDMLL